MGKLEFLIKNGRLRIPFEYKSLYGLDDNDQLFIADNKIIDLDNKPILFGYDRITPIYYNSQRFIVSKNKKYGIVDIKIKYYCL